MKLKSRHVLGFILCVVLGSWAHAEAYFYAVVEGGTAKLQWQPQSWGNDQIGFALKRRVITDPTAGAWQPIGPAVMRPSINYGRDWTEVGCNRKQGAVLTAHVKATKMDRLPVISADTVQGLFKRDQRIPAGDGIAMMRDATHAFAWGLGWVDNTVKPKVGYEYGLFEMATGGVVGAEPVAMARPLLAAEKAEWLKTTGGEISPRLFSGNEVEMRWRMPAAQAKGLAVAYCIVERRGEEEKDWTVVSPEVPYSLRNIRKEARWTCTDKVSAALAAKPLHYRIIPVDMFQEKMPAAEYTVISMKPAAPDSALYGPSQLVGHIEKGKLHVEWAQKAVQWRSSTLKGFRLRNALDFQSSMEVWPASARQAEIEVAKLGEIKTYKLDAVYADWDDVESTIESVETLNLDAIK